jgi:hypothetical protein
MAATWDGGLVTDGQLVEAGSHRPPTSTHGLVLDGFIVVLVLVGLMVDDRSDFDEAEGGSQAAQGRRLVGVDLGHGPRLATAVVARRVGPRGAGRPGRPATRPKSTSRSQ